MGGVFHQQSREAAADFAEDRETRARVARLNYTYIFDEMTADASILFSEEVRGGTVYVHLNRQHPAYASLIDHIDNDRDGHSAVELLLIAWMEMESDLQGRKKDIAENNRHDWGRTLRRIIRQKDGRA